MDFKDKVPKTGYDLIDVIDQMVDRPQLPKTASGFRLLADPGAQNATAFSCGMRALADAMVEWKNAEIAARLKADNPEVSEDDISLAQAAQRGPDIYTPEGGLHRPLASGSTAVSIDPRKLGA